MITRDKSITPTAEVIRGALSEFLRDVQPRLMRMHEAYAGKGPITRRERAVGLPNNRLDHAFPRYIVTMAAGYLAGNPIKYEAEEQQDALRAITDAYDACDIDSIDSELANDASIYGKGVCVCYANELAEPRAATLDPRQAFVVYDDTVEHKPLFGVHWYNTYKADGTLGDTIAHVHTADQTLIFRGASANTLEFAGAEPHQFGAVPLIEFWNGSTETGDFEPVLSLIEAYDVIESDRVNDKQQFTDAILLLTGCTLENSDPDDERSPAQKLIEEKTLALPDMDAKAEWLIKPGDEAGNEILKNAIKADIHKMSLVPDLTDENFASNASGVAMRYKLLGLEQLTKNKERWFRQALRERLIRFANFLGVLGKPTVDARAVQITFTRALPTNDTEIAAMVAQLQGMVPNQVLLAQLPFVEDVQEALDQLAEQQDADMERRAAMISDYPTGSGDAKGEDQEDDKNKGKPDAQKGKAGKGARPEKRAGK